MSMKYQEKNILTIISNSNVSYIRWDKQNSWGFRQVYSLHLREEESLKPVFFSS